MLRVALVGLLIATLACGGSKDTTAPPPPPPPPPVGHGTITFSIGPTCTGSHQTYFEIDSTEVGPELLAAGGVSKAYPTTAEEHATHARFANYFGSASLWSGNLRVTVPADGTVNRLITC
jgi:hypothetical protein